MIGERLAELRTKQNMTQEEFAEYMEVSRQAVSKWELDKSLPDVGKLLKMSELFQVSIDYLLKGTEVADCGTEEITEDMSGNDLCVSDITDAEIQKIEEAKDEAPKPDEEEQNKDRKKSKKRIVISLALTGVLLLAVLALLIGVLRSQVWNGADSSRELVKVNEIHVQYSLADVSACDADGNTVTKTVLLDTNGVRTGDYIYCYTNTTGDRILVNYTAWTIVAILIAGVILLGIWILLFREAGRR